MYRQKKKKPQSTAFKLIDKIILVLNILLVLALLASNLSSSIDPRDVTYVAILGFGFLILFAVNLLFIIYWVIRKRYIITLLSVIPALISIYSLSCFISINTQPDKQIVKEASTIRFMQYNVAKFTGVGIWDKTSIITPIADLIETEKPDILANEEFVTTGQENIDSIKNAMGAPYVFF